MTYAGSDEPVVDRTGGLVAGRYRLRSRLGAGAMGVVWLALDERLQRLVAVKQLWPDVGRDPVESERSRQRIMREGRIAARLRHPHAVTVHDVAEHDGQPVLVMEYVPARSLAAVVAEQGPLAPVAAARIGAQVASALAAAHEAGIVHRDVKPGNVLVGDDGAAKIADFGISHAVGDVSVTDAGVFAGTPAFLAPEVARGRQPTPESDVFSLGSTLYAAVEGAPPFGAGIDNPLAVLHRVAAADVPPAQRAGLLTPVLVAMLSADPGQRLTAEQVTSALQAVADGRPIAPATPEPPGDRTQPVAATIPVAAVQNTKLDLPPATPFGGTGTSRRGFLLPVAGVLVAGLGVTAILLTTTPLDPSSAAPPAPAPSTTPSVTAPPVLGSATLTGAVSDYYVLLPGRPDEAWSRLGPALRAQGRTAYRTFWSAVTRLTVTAPPQATAANTVSVGLEVILSNGMIIRETHQLGLIPGDGTPLINTDTVVSSVTSTPPPPPATEDHKGKGEENKKGGAKKGKDG